MLEVAAAHGVSVALYVIPLNPRADNPYVPAEYAAFKSWLDALAQRHAVPFANLEEAACRIASMVHGRTWRSVAYESLVQRPQLVFSNLCNWLGVPAVDVGEIFDANERYFGSRVT